MHSHDMDELEINEQTKKRAYDCHIYNAATKEFGEKLDSQVCFKI